MCSLSDSFISKILKVGGYLLSGYYIGINL